MIINDKKLIKQISKPKEYLYSENAIQKILNVLNRNFIK